MSRADTTTQMNDQHRHRMPANPYPYLSVSLPLPFPIPLPRFSFPALPFHLSPPPQFVDMQSSASAKGALQGRTFGGRPVVVSYFPVDMYEQGRLEDITKAPPPPAPPVA